MLKNRKKIAVVLLSSSLSILAIGFSAAKFRGGNIQDIPNRIQQAIETAKLSEAGTYYKQFTEFKEKMTKELQGLQQAKRDIEDLIGNVNGLKKYTQGVLNADNVKKDIQKLYTFDLNIQGEISDAALEGELKRIEGMQETELLQSIQVANDTSELTQKINAEAEKIIAMKSDGTLSEAQKLAMLRVLYVKAKNMRAMADNQSLMIDVSQNAVERANDKLHYIDIHKNQIVIPQADSVMGKKLEEGRIKELPR